MDEAPRPSLGTDMHPNDISSTPSAPQDEVALRVEAMRFAMGVRDQNPSVYQAISAAQKIYNWLREGKSNAF